MSNTLYSILEKVNQVKFSVIMNGCKIKRMDILLS